jgi:hypothetical protein
MSIRNVFFGLFASTLIILASVNKAIASGDVHTDIILINGVAVLADYDQKGEILKEYAEVPYYFSSYQSHETIVKKTTAKFKGLSAKPHKVFDENHFLSATYESNETTTICTVTMDTSDTDYINYGHIQPWPSTQVVAIRQRMKLHLS